MKIYEFTLIPDDKERPIKIVYDNGVKFRETGDCTIEMVKHLTPMESEGLLMDLFGTTDVRVLDCSDMAEEEFNKIVDRFADIPTVNPITYDELVKAMELFEKNKEPTDA